MYIHTYSIVLMKLVILFLWPIPRVFVFFLFLGGSVLAFQRLVGFDIRESACHLKIA